MVGSFRKLLRHRGHNEHRGGWVRFVNPRRGRRRRGEPRMTRMGTNGERWVRFVVDAPGRMGRGHRREGGREAVGSFRNFHEGHEEEVRARMNTDREGARGGDGAQRTEVLAVPRVGEGVEQETCKKEVPGGSLEGPDGSRGGPEVRGIAGWRRFVGRRRGRGRMTKERR